MNANDFFGLGTTYYEMADFVEKEGGDPNIYRAIGYKMKLQSDTNARTLEGYLSSGHVSHVEILANPGSCNLCKKISGKKFSIEESVKNPPIPIKDCAHKYGCRCVYLPSRD